MNTYVALIILLLSVIPTVLPAAETNVTGKWTYEKEVGDADGKKYPHKTEMNLNQEGDSLTGTVVQTSDAPWMREITGRSIEITDGNVEGNKVSFRIQIVTSRNQRVSQYDGIVEDGHFTGILKFRGIGISETFDAKRSQ